MAPVWVMEPKAWDVDEATRRGQFRWEYSWGLDTSRLGSRLHCPPCTSEALLPFVSTSQTGARVARDHLLRYLDTTVPWNLEACERRGPPTASAVPDRRTDQRAACKTRQAAYVRLSGHCAPVICVSYS